MIIGSNPLFYFYQKEVQTMQQMDGATMAAMLKSRFGDSVKVSPDTEQVELTEEQLAEINSNAAADEQAQGFCKELIHLEENLAKEIRSYL